MYLSRVWLDPHRRGARRLLSSPQRIHAVVAGAVSHGGEAGRPLWRLDAGQSGLQLLVVSQHEPDFTSLLEQSEMPPEDGWQTTPYGPFLDGLSAGQAWRFRLAANPVKNLRTVSDPDKLPRGKRVPIVGIDDLTQWLTTRAPSIGIEVDDGSFIVTEKRAESFHRHDSSQQPRPAGEQRVFISRVQFDGNLRVLDASALRTALTTGVGSGKAYGCGLLTLAPGR